MTFKHTKHWDSELSRSLEKIALAKGLVKPEPAIKKSAAVTKKADTFPTSNLMENILKLCAGMRSNGLIEEALEVETNYLNYKSAQTLYEAFKETGDDVIQQAHPDGSHKMENVDSDEATFEDILDKHVKILQVLNKKPTGKLSSAAQVLKAVKMVLGGPVEFSASQLGGSAWSKLLGRIGGGGIELATPAAEIGGETAAVGVGAVGSVAGAALIGAIGGALIGNALFTHYLAPDDLKDAGEKLIKKCKDLKDNLPPGANDARQNFEIAFGATMTNYSVIADLQESKNPNDLLKLKELDDQLWKTNKLAQTIWSWARSAADDSWKPKFLTGPADVVALAKNYMDKTNEITSLIDKFVKNAAQAVTEKTQQQVASTGGNIPDNLNQKYDLALKTVKNYIDRITAARPKDQAALLGFLQGRAAVITSEQAEFSKIDPANKASVTKYYSDRLDAINNGLNAFKANKLS